MMVDMAAPERTGTGRRRGRRPGGANTRAQLLDAARAEFAERGYEGATVRAIADRAGVDPAMVNHFFGGKDGLFPASLDLPRDAPAPRGSCRGSCSCGTPPAAARWSPWCAASPRTRRRPG